MNNLDIFLNNKDVLNSITKYPSIETYHTLGEKGKPTDNRYMNDFLEQNPNEIVYLTEKIDGTNTRIIVYCGDYIVGSREELLYAHGDRIINPAMGITETVMQLSDINNMRNYYSSPDYIYIFYGETYGGKVTANSKNYTDNAEKYGFRLFDIAYISIEDIGRISGAKEAASYREHDLKFLDMNRFSHALDKINVTKVPYIENVCAAELPVQNADVEEWLKEKCQYTSANLSGDCGKSAEGIVLRNADRSYISKARFDDYRKLTGK